MNLPEPENLDGLLRKERRSARLGTRLHCELCRYADPTALRQRQTTVCANCAARLDGRSPIERHHPLGRQVSPETIRVPANFHDYLSDCQRDWPDVLSSADDHLIFIATLLRAIGNFCAYIALHAVECSDYLLRLRENSIRCFGQSWESQLLA